jgi:hypothetical protein
VGILTISIDDLGLNLTEEQRSFLEKILHKDIYLSKKLLIEALHPEIDFLVERIVKQVNAFLYFHKKDKVNYKEFPDGKIWDSYYLKDVDKTWPDDKVKVLLKSYRSKQMYDAKYNARSNEIEIVLSNVKPDFERLLTHELTHYLDQLKYQRSDKEKTKPVDNTELYIFLTRLSNKELQAKVHEVITVIKKDRDTNLVDLLERVEFWNLIDLETEFAGSRIQAIYNDMKRSAPFL